jgi:hypothetical protein
MNNFEDKKKFLAKALKENKISEEYYINEIVKLDGQQEEAFVQKRLKENPTLSYEDGHFITHLTCPKCRSNGIVSHIHNDFRLLGKDKEGFIYFECPNCKTHLQWDSLYGSIKSNKGILGFLFNKFK